MESVFQVLDERWPLPSNPQRWRRHGLLFETLPEVITPRQIKRRLRDERDFLSTLRLFENWRHVLLRHLVGGGLPALSLRPGLVLNHGPDDDPLFLLREIFLGECYTYSGFYRPSSLDTVVDIGANIGVFVL